MCECILEELSLFNIKTSKINILLNLFLYVLNQSKKANKKYPIPITIHLIVKANPSNIYHTIINTKLIGNKINQLHKQFF